MLLNASVQYAVIILTELKGKVDPVRAYEIVKKHNISAAFVDQLCRKLRDAGWIKSMRGPGGGYSLVKEDISLLEVMDLLSEWKSNKTHDAVVGHINQVKNALADIHV